MGKLLRNYEYLRLPVSRIGRQKFLVISIIFGVLAVSLILATYRWPDLPYHRTLCPDKYAERMSLLKFFISIACSGIVATWWVTCSAKPNHDIYRISINTMSWAWTFLGVSILSAIAEVYLTYKDFWYNPLTAESAFANFVHEFFHSFVVHTLQATYVVTDLFFFLGWCVLILALVGTGKAGQTPLQ